MCCIASEEYWEDWEKEEEFHYLNPTLIVNFDKEDERYYQMAIRECGRGSLFIMESVGYEGDKSLHDSKMGDLSNFWRLFDSIKKDFEGR